MQVIDAHVHVGRNHLPMEQVQIILDKSGVDRAVVFADPESNDIPDDNRYVLEVADRTEHIPFFYIGGNAYSTNRPFPELPEPEVLEPYRGIKWHCWFTPGHDFGGTELGMNDEQINRSLTEPRMKKLMQKVRQMGIPVNFEEHFDVTVCFVDLYPEISIIIPHMGGLNGGTERVLQAVGDRPNVHFDVSLAGINEALIGRYGADKFICGSDHPYGSPAWSVERIRHLHVSEEDRDKIFSRNILSLTGLA